MNLNNDIASAGPNAELLPLRRVLVERRPGELLPIDMAKRSCLVITEHGVWRRSNRSIAEAALSVCHAGADPKNGALAYVVVGDSEAHFTEDSRIVHGAAALVCGPIPVAWLASLLGPGGVPAVRPTGGAS